ncbi:hypothetical protein CRG98_007610 [Punica granatum]|uniref:Uncharacterized protein n=1 Tax=Punica granatum TaxID=22663 RepID=A0A2I0KU45_PUNGR|nr:hypothetical protein CRG98_007610 [Punica granatum]
MVIPSPGMRDETVKSRVGPLVGQSCRVDLYNPAKITKSRARLGNRPDWAVCGSDVTTVAPDGILRQGQWLPTPNRPLEVGVIGSGYPVFFIIPRPYPVRDRFQDFGTGPYPVESWNRNLPGTCIIPQGRFQPVPGISGTRAHPYLEVTAVVVS